MSEEQTRVFRAYDPEKQFEMLEEASDELAKAVYKEFLVEKNEKILLSKLISEHLLGGNISSVAKAEHAARCSKEYLTHIKGLAIAKKFLDCGAEVIAWDIDSVLQRVSSNMNKKTYSGKKSFR